jgi:hypothetical protein
MNNNITNKKQKKKFFFNIHLPVTTKNCPHEASPHATDAASYHTTKKAPIHPHDHGDAQESQHHTPPRHPTLQHDTQQQEHQDASLNAPLHPQQPNANNTTAPEPHSEPTLRPIHLPTMARDILEHILDKPAQNYGHHH